MEFKQVKPLAKALIKRSLCDFGLLLCGKDPAIQKERDEFLEIRKKHEAVIQDWKKQRGR